MPAHHIQVAHRVYSFLALIALATATLLLGTHLHLGWGGVAISLAIAAVKTFLVLWFFMDMAEQPFRSRLVIGVSLILVVLLVALTIADVDTRQVMPAAPAPQLPEAFYRR
jgi:caa(3)-type oxidase subunit IV